MLDDRLQVVDPRLDEALLVLGSVVLEVLREVAKLAGSFDLGCNVGPAVGNELVELLFDRLQALGSDVDVVGHDSESKRRGTPGPFL